jgi:hypothetical protein
MPYSPVTQPSLEFFIHLGTLFSIDALQMTFVLPNEIRTEPSA